MKKFLSLLAILMLVSSMLTGCDGNDDTIQTMVISNEGYETQKKLETAAQPETLAAGQAIYATIHFIESPKGMEYSVKWYVDGTEVKEETKATQNNAQDIVMYELEQEQASAGMLKLEVLYKDTILRTQELSIQ